MNFLSNIFGKKQSIPPATIKLHEVSSNSEVNNLSHEVGETDISKLREDGLKAAQVGDLEHAVEAWQSVVSVQSDDAKIHFLLGAAYQVLHNVDSAARHYRMVIKLEPRNVEVHINLATLLTSAAIKMMSKTGQQFTMEQALRTYGYHEEALRSFASCLELSQRVEGDVMKNHLRHYQNYFGVAIETAKPISGITGDVIYRKSSDWLQTMNFTQESFIIASKWGEVIDLLGAEELKGIAIVLAHPQSLKKLSQIMKNRKQRFTEIGPSMDDTMVKNSVSCLSRGDVLLANIERIALSSDFPWIKNPLWKQLDLVLINPDLMLLPELLGALARTSISNMKGAERGCRFISLMNESIVTGKHYHLEDCD